jgi:hypothetical protein
MKLPLPRRLRDLTGRDARTADEGTDTRVDLDPGRGDAEARAEAPAPVAEQREPVVEREPVAEREPVVERRETPRAVDGSSGDEQPGQPFFFADDRHDTADAPNGSGTDGSGTGGSAGSRTEDAGLFQGASDDDTGRRGLPVRTVMLVLAVLCLVLVTAVLVRTALRGAPQAPSEAASRGRTTVPAPPPGAPRYGSYVEARATGDGDVAVAQWIRSPSALLGVQLSLPPVTGGSGSVSASRLSVVADQSVLNDPTTVHASGRRLFFSAPPTMIYLRYTLHGVAERSPSVAGRALLRATALDVGYTPQTGPSEVVLVGDNVLSASCVAPGASTPRPCGDAAKGRWDVTLKGHHRADSVMAQVNLG